jgi:TonB-linked SusC/RagA family outer membrane protein
MPLINFKKNYFLALFLILVEFVIAQQIQLKGIVLSDGFPLPGANITILETNQGVVSDFDGNFSIDCNINQTLVVTYIGFKTFETPVTSDSFIQVELEPDLSELNEVIVTGYGSQLKKEVTGAVAKVSGESIAKSATYDLNSALQGVVAGVNVQASSGRPGQSANIQIRGLGSINPGGLGPLYVVDGVPYEGNPNIAPEQIKSVDILKDGASASIYGTRASNGVILITTKRGKVGEFKVDFNTYSGFQNITSGTALMNTLEQFYAEEIVMTALGRESIVLLLNPRALENNSDFVGDVQNNNAVISNYNLNVSGGVENLKLNLSTNYFNQDGILISSGFNRLSNRITGEFTKGKFKAFSTISYNKENTKQEPFALYELAMVQKPYQAPLFGLSPVGETGVQLPVQNEIQYSYLSRELNNIDDREVNSSNIALNLSYNLSDNLDLKVNFGKNTWDYSRKFFKPQYLVYNRLGDYSPGASRENATLDESFIWNNRQTLEGIVDYKLNLKDHKLKFTGVISYEQFDSKNVGTGVIFSDVSSNDLQTLGSGAEAVKPTGFNETRTISGKLLRAQYNYKDKYLLSASLRRDGSSKFSKNNRYGDFYGFSAGWNVHEETFFKSNVINSLKMRVSWAQVGNQNIASYSFSPLIESGSNYPFGYDEDLSFGNIQRRYVDPNIKWETTISQNIGVDLSMFDYKLNLTADFYLNKKEDMLLQERLPASSGTYHPNGFDYYSTRVINAGNMENKGIELAINFKDQTSYGLNYSMSATFTKNQNIVTNLNGTKRGYANGRPVLWTGDRYDYTTFLAEGYEAGAFFLVEHAGVIKTQEQLDSYKAIDPSAMLGDMMYVDQDGDNDIDDDDRVYKGSGQSEFEIGYNINLNYKRFDLFIQTYYAHGAEVYNGSRLYAYSVGRHKDFVNMWSPQNANSDIPTHRQNSYHNNFRARSDFFLEDGTYFRIRNLALGYTMPVLRELGINKFRIYVSSINPLTITNYKGYDPEIGGDGIFTRGVDRGNYPISRQFLLGLQLSF